MAACAVAAGLLCLLFLLYWLNPVESPLFPKCPFYVLTGLKCPGCGSQRAIHSLLRLHVADAFGYNALLVGSMPFLACLVVAGCLRRRHPKPYLWLSTPTATALYLLIIIAWWVCRNVYGL